MCNMQLFYTPPLHHKKNQKKATLFYCFVLRSAAIKAQRPAVLFNAALRVLHCLSYSSFSFPIPPLDSTVSFTHTHTHTLLSFLSVCQQKKKGGGRDRSNTSSRYIQKKKKRRIYNTKMSRTITASHMQDDVSYIQEAMQNTSTEQDSQQQSERKITSPCITSQQPNNDSINDTNGNAQQQQPANVNPHDLDTHTHNRQSQNMPNLQQLPTSVRGAPLELRRIIRKRQNSEVSLKVLLLFHLHHCLL